MSKYIKVRDVKTSETFTIEAYENRASIVTQDGVKVRLYPTTIKSMVKKGEQFGGQTITGTRPLVRIM